jgi:hypothetical protein
LEKATTALHTTYIFQFLLTTAAVIRRIGEPASCAMPFFRRFESIIFMHIQQFIAAY